MIIFQSSTDPSLLQLIRQGAVGVIPTDTLYGLVARADQPASVRYLYELKHREKKPGTTIAASVAQLAKLGIGQQYLDQVARWWPGPLSVILPVPQSLAHVHQGLGDAPFRVVADSRVAALLEQTGPLTTSSANHPGGKPASNLAEAQAYFGDSVDFYVDGGEIGDRPPSTIIKIDQAGDLQLIRQGAVATDNLKGNN